jgi:hypothetical protein
LPLTEPLLNKKELRLGRFRDSGHLVRPAAVLLAGLALFMVLRGMVVPKDFGKYGHYRAGALDAAAAKPLGYAGQEACAMCHDEQVSARNAGRHAKIACEACHGPLAAHANDPASLTPKRPDTAVLCKRCHEKDAAKPKTFPQVVTAEHSGGAACKTCHKPHNPHL